MGALARTTSGEHVQALIRDRSAMQDGQEDPGAVETDALGVELALAKDSAWTVEDIPKSAPPATARGPARPGPHGTTRPGTGAGG